MAFHFIVQKFYQDHEYVRKNSNNIINKRAHMCKTSTKKSNDSGANARLQKLEKTVKSQNHIITKMTETLQSLTSAIKARPETPAPTPTIKAETPKPVPNPSVPIQGRISALQDQIKLTIAKIQSSSNAREIAQLRETLNALTTDLDALEAQQLRSNLKKQAENQDVAFLAAWRSGNALTARNLFNRPW